MSTFAPHHAAPDKLSVFATAGGAVTTRTLMEAVFLPVISYRLVERARPAAARRAAA